MTIQVQDLYYVAMRLQELLQGEKVEQGLSGAQFEERWEMARDQLRREFGAEDIDWKLSWEPEGRVLAYFNPEC